MSCDQPLITIPRLRPPCVQLLLGGSELMGKRERELSCLHGTVGVCRLCTSLDLEVPYAVFDPRSVDEPRSHEMGCRNNIN